MSVLNEILKQIDDNKEFPAYQAERRLDIFINYFLADILKICPENSGKQNKIEFIAPEFPLKKEKGNQSTNIDYLCLKIVNRQISRLLFVELKTDVSSFNIDQFEIYCEYLKEGSCERGFNGVCNIAISKGMPFIHRKKYYHLIKVLYNKRLAGPLAQSKLFQELDEILDHESKASEDELQIIKVRFSQKLKELVAHLKESCVDYPISLYYIGPKEIENLEGFDKNKATLIPFEDLSNKATKAKHSGLIKTIVKSLNKEK